MKIWECQLLGDGRAECPHEGSRQIDVTEAPCIFEDYPTNHNIVRSATVEDTGYLALNNVTVALGSAAILVVLFAAIAARREVRARVPGVLFFLSYLALIGVASVVGSVVLRFQRKDDSDIVCEGMIVEGFDCAQLYVCNGKGLEDDNEDLAVAVVLLFGTSFILTLLALPIAVCATSWIVPGFFELCKRRRSRRRGDPRHSKILEVDTCVGA